MRFRRNLSFLIFLASFAWAPESALAYDPGAALARAPKRVSDAEYQSIGAE
jgi:hypothetical protein